MVVIPLNIILTYSESVGVRLHKKHDIMIMQGLNDCKMSKSWCNIINFSSSNITKVIRRQFVIEKLIGDLNLKFEY